VRMGTGSATGGGSISSGNRVSIPLSPSLRTRDLWNMSQFKMPRSLFLVKEEYLPNAINLLPIKEKYLSCHILNEISCAQHPTD